VCSSQNNTGAIESWKMDWAGRMHAREDKMPQHIVYCLGSKKFVLPSRFSGTSLLVQSYVVAKCAFQLSYVYLCLSVRLLSLEGFALNFMFDTFIKMCGEIRI